MYEQWKKIISVLAVICLIIPSVLAPAIARGESYEGYATFDEYVLGHPEIYDAEPEPPIATHRMLPKKANRMVARGATESTVDRYSVLVLDVSGSMTGDPLRYAKQAAISFCEQVLQTDGNNFVAVVSFSQYAYIDSIFTNDLISLQNAINGLGISGGTSQYTGLVKADLLLSEITNSNAIKNILLMSDGLPEHGEGTAEGPYNYNDFRGYKYANKAFNKADQMKPNYNIFTLGFFHRISSNDLIFGRRFMKDIQNKGYYEVLDPTQLEFEFGAIANQIISKKGTFKYAGLYSKSKDSSAVYHYSDDYFSGNSTIYNNSLSTMSLCLELSSWPSHDKKLTKWKDKSQNARDLLTGEGGLGFKDFDYNPFWESDPTTESIGVVAANKKIGNSHLIALAVRGGGYESEWSSNFELGKNGQHQGFSKAKNNVIDYLSTYISKFDIEGNIKLWLVGYSRGGAVANLVAGELNSKPLSNNVTLAHDDLFCYTFEAPQGALISHVNNGDHSNIHNVINLNDLVPLVAPLYWNFRRFNMPRDHILPAASTTSTFPIHFSGMDTQYKSILKTAAIDNDKKKKSEYQVPEYTRTSFEIIDHPTKILPGGDPYLELIATLDTSVSNGKMLSDLMKNLTISLKSRDNYHSNIENDLKFVVNKKWDLLPSFFVNYVEALYGNYAEGFCFC